MTLENSHETLIMCGMFFIVGTDDGDLKFNYLSTFGPRFRKLADMYGDSDDERAGPHEESWC